MKPSPAKNQARYLSRLIKRRGGEKKRPAAGHRLTMKFWIAMCREYEPLKVHLLQSNDGGGFPE